MHLLFERGTLHRSVNGSWIVIFHKNQKIAMLQMPVSSKTALCIRFSKWTFTLLCEVLTSRTKNLLFGTAKHLSLLGQRVHTKPEEFSECGIFFAVVPFVTICCCVGYDGVPNFFNALFLHIHDGVVTRDRGEAYLSRSLTKVQKMHLNGISPPITETTAERVMER